MTCVFRQLAAALAASLCLAGPARATSYSVDFTDLWWNSPAGSEDGWGMNVIQQDQTLFLTFFLYGTDGTARWYVASGATPTNPQPVGAVRFSGALYQTTGPWFGGPFNRPMSGGRKWGSVTLTFDSPQTGTLSYRIGGTPVVKAIERQNYRVNSVEAPTPGGHVALALGLRQPR